MHKQKIKQKFSKLSKASGALPVLCAVLSIFLIQFSFGENTSREKVVKAINAGGEAYILFSARLKRPIFDFPNSQINI